MTAPAFHEAWLGAVREVIERGVQVAPRGMPVLEKLASQIRFDGNRPLLFHPVRDLNYRFAVAEFVWMATGSDLVEPVARYNSVMRRFSDDGVTLAGAYGPRLAPQWDRVVKALQADPDSRQAVAVIWRPTDASPDVVDLVQSDGVNVVRRVSKDVPCTIAAQFLLRRGALHGIWTMRSNDLWLGTPYDAFTFARLTACVAGELAVPVGDVVIQAGSSHLYEEHWPAVFKVLGSEDQAASLVQPPIPGFPPKNGLFMAGEPWATYARVLESAGKAEALELLR